jgi:hypothetical protein
VEAAIRAVVVRAVPASHALRTWLDSWAGIGHVAVGMARQSYGLKLTRYDETAGEPLFTRRGWSTHEATGTGWGAHAMAGGVGGVQEGGGELTVPPCVRSNSHTR